MSSSLPSDRTAALFGPGHPSEAELRQELPHQLGAGRTIFEKEPRNVTLAVHPHMHHGSITPLGLDPCLLSDDFLKGLTGTAIASGPRLEVRNRTRVCW